MRKFLKKRLVYHILIWIGIICFFLLVTYNRESEESFIDASLYELVALIPLVILVYINFYVKSITLDKNRYWLYVIFIICIIPFGIILFEQMKRFGHFTENDILQHISNVIGVITLSTGLQYLKRGVVGQIQLQELKVKTVENELNALKAQLNPHFLFNTLNNIYGINQINSEIGSEMILELSTLMRYHLESSKAGQVLLKRELDLLESYIKLEKLRLPEQCNVQFNMTQIKGNMKIAPLILLPFVENAFKHGTHSTKSSFVYIDCFMVNNKFSIEVRNSIFEKKNVVKTNIGLENTKRRLDLIYNDQYKLDFHKSESEYKINLNVQLS